jgi:thiamine biosynthesis lipoprotein
MKRFYLFLILSVFLLSCSEKKNTPQSENRFLIGTVCIITLYDGETSDIFDGAFRIIEEQDLLMSLNHENSELMQINRKAGIEPVIVSKDLYRVVKTALFYSKLSSGALDPTIAPLVQLWGIGEDSTGTVPDIGLIDKNRVLTDYRKLQLTEPDSVYLQEKGMEIDLGAIAKGYIADLVKEYLQSRGVTRGIINLGGNILVMGAKSENQPWRIGIQNPFDSRGNHIGIASVAEKTIVTSGIYERYFYFEGKRYHHILDPQTGFPVENDLASVTIIADTSIDADALSTSLFILGVKKGIELIETVEKTEAVFVTKEKKVIYSSGASDFFTLSHKDFSNITFEEYQSIF